jgi:hypothetical protein
MTLAILTVPTFKATDANGLPLALGKLYSYAAGTDTLQALYAADGVTALSNPVILNASGEANIRLGSRSYKLNLLSALDAQQTGFPVDNIQGVDVQQNSFNVEAYGASPTGTAAANTTAITAAIAACAAATGTLVFPRLYPVNSVKILNGVRAVVGPGGLLDNGIVSQGVLCLDGPSLLSGTAVQYCRIEGLRISLANGAARGIFLDGSKHVTIRDCFIDGFVNGASDREGIRGYYGCQDITVTGNHIINTVTAITQPYQHRGILFVGDSNFTPYFASPFGTAALSDGANVCTNLTIANNTCLYGSHGIQLNSVVGFTVSGNTLYGQRDRAIICEPMCAQGTIAGNSCLQWKSSAVLLANGNRNIVVSGNLCMSSIANGEAAINLYTGNEYVTIVGNQVKMESGPDSLHASLYGIALGPASRFCTVKDNQITGPTLAAIVVENEWYTNGTGVTNASDLYAHYAGSDPGANTVGGSYWAFNNCEYIVIEGNSIYERVVSLASRAVIALAQQGVTTNINNVHIVGNQGMVGANYTHFLHIYEGNTGAVQGLKMAGNHWLSATAAKFVFPRGRLHFTVLEGNEYTDMGDYARVAFTDGDTAPSILHGRRFQCANTAPTSITTFTNARTDGDLISVRLDNQTTLVHASGVMRLQGGVNVVGVSSDQIVELERISSIWFERHRNFTGVPVVQVGTFSASNGNNDDCAIPAAAHVRLTGPSAAFAIRSMVGGVGGRQLVLQNATAQDMTISNNVGGTAANQILTQTGADVTLTAQSVATFLYSSLDSRWLLTATFG